MTQAVIERADQREQQRRVDRRSRQARLVELAAHLPEAERLLIEQIYDHGLSAAELARLTGDHPRALQRRVVRLTRRMRHPTFRLTVEYAHLIPRELAPTARRVVLRGQSMRAAAEQSNRTLHRVRQDMQALYALTATFVGPVHRRVGG